MIWTEVATSECMSDSADLVVSRRPARRRLPLGGRAFSNRSMSAHFDKGVADDPARH